jgi:hypothetical protein
VLSALEGLNIATPAVKPYVLPAAVVILVALFFCRLFGGEVGRLLAEAWRTGAAKALERQFAAFVQAPAKNPV